MKAAFGAGVACLFLFFHSAAMAQGCRLQRAVSLDMHFGEAGLAVIPATIGGAEHSLAIDTGSPYTLLNEARAREMELRLEPLPPQTLFMFDGTPIRYMARASGFMLGRTPVANFNFLVLPGNQSSKGEDGLLGGDVMSRMDVDFDFGAMKFNLISPNKCGDGVVYWADAYARLPLEFDDAVVTQSGRREEPTHIYAKAKLDDREIKIAVDTGASISAMTMVQARHVFGWSEPPADWKKVENGDGRDIYLMPVKTLMLGPVAISNPRLAIIDVKGSVVDQDYDMLLGMDVLKLFHLYISYAQKMIYFTPLPEKPAAGPTP